ncbi:hypothetical protein F4779DRAFT_608528 [Xylariaceae sp. FL0662B]|nr:hypothetical protein F4779DRAFT_608528 [Xylariaceae sp. FL0662B]
MATPERYEAQPSTTSTRNNNTDHHHELLQSLNKLSLSTSSTHAKNASNASNASNANNANSPRLSRSPHSNAPSRSTSERLSSVSPHSAGAPPRSPFPSQSRSATTTPTLLRKTSSSSLRSVSGINPGRAPSRRGSSALLSPTATKTPLSGTFPMMEEYREKPAPTAASVASAYFQKELELLHETTSEDSSAETIVILNDACYGHRFSRPRSSKATLNTIVERPERIQASVLGVSIAYVRLGERHCDGKNPIHPDLDPMSLPNIPFRIHKTTRSVALTSTVVTNVHGTKWMEELKIMCESAESKLALNGNEMRRPEMNRGPDAEQPEKFHEGDLYLCSESLNAFEGALGAVCEAVDTVFSDSPQKRAFVAARPPGHHCSAAHPSGFCWVNNVHVGIMHGILNHGLTHAAIIDFDLHHGDGSQAIAWQHNKRGLTKNAAAWKKTSIGYFSLHDINSYPCEWGDEDKVKNASLCIENAHGQNIWNVHLQEWKSDVEFWKFYQHKYSILLEKARNYLRLQTERYRAHGQVPKAAIFVSAGFDASEWEGAGMQRHKVNVPTEFYARITRDVVRIASEEGLSVEGRVISVLEGGYSDRALYSGVLSHLGGLAGREPMTPRGSTPRGSVSNGLNFEMGNRIGSFSRRSTLTEDELKSFKTPGFPFDPTWWSTAELDRLEAAMAAPPPEPKKTRTVNIGNYSSPTQASTAKMTEVAKARRSMSGLAERRTIISRPPTPPPPDVPWTSAAHELSKLLIPNNRQIHSCKHEELNAEATKVRRDRQAVLVQDGTNGVDTDAPVSVPTRAPTRMSLRERKPPKSIIEDDNSKTRRKTVGGPAFLAAEKASARGIPMPNGSKHGRQPSRRLSGTSALTTAGEEPNGLAGAISRPTSSLTIRPESSISVRASTTSLNVKKTRPPAPPKKEGTRATRAPKKTKAPTTIADTKPAQPAVPTQATSANPNGDASMPLRPSSAGPSKTSPPVVSDTANDLEKITNGMKRIKINVLTKEKKEAKQRAEAEKAAMEQKKAEEEVQAAAAANTPIPSIENNLVSPIVPEAEDTALPPSQHDATQNQSNIFREAGQVRPIEATNGFTPIETKVEPPSPERSTVLTPIDSNQTPFTSSSPVQTTPDAAHGEDLFVQYQPNGPPPTSIPISGPIQILDPNSGTPAQQNKFQHHPFNARSLPSSPARKGGHGFTATSDIPFAPRPASKDGIPTLTHPQAKTATKEQDVWEIPETPQHGR